MNSSSPESTTQDTDTHSGEGGGKGGSITYEAEKTCCKEVTGTIRTVYVTGEEEGQAHEGQRCLNK